MNTLRKNRYEISLDIVLAVFAFLYLIKMNTHFLFDADLYMEVKCAELYWQLKGTPYYDPFCWAPIEDKVQWVNIEWLAYTMLFLTQKWAGNFFLGPILYKTMLYCVSFFILFWYAYKQYGLRPALLALIVAIFLGRWFLGPRPMCHTAVFFPLLIYLLLGLQQGRLTIKRMVVFPVLYLVWVNFHGGFFVGLVFMTLCFVVISIMRLREATDRAEKLRILLTFSITWLSCLLVTIFCTPYGTKVFQYVLDWLFFRRIFMLSASDMAPPYLRPWLNIHYFVIISVTLILLLLYRFRYKCKISPIELCAFFFWLLASLRGARNMQLLATASTPVFAYIFYNSAILISRTKLYSRAANFFKNRRFIPAATKLILLILVLTLFTFQLAKVDFTGRTSEKRIYPLGLIDFLKHNELPSRLYCHDIMGDILMYYYLYPEYTVSYDSRWNMVVTDQYFKRMTASFRNRDDFFSFVKKYDLDTIIIDYKYHADFIKDDPRWLIVYEGEKCRVFLRNAKRNSEIIEKFQQDELYYPETNFDLNAFLFRSHMARSNYKSARKYLRRLIVAKPDEIELRQCLSQLNNHLKKMENLNNEIYNPVDDDNEIEKKDKVKKKPGYP